MENKKYCVWCGKEYTAEIKHCTACGKNPDPSENMLADWLYNNTKDKLKGDIEGTIYEKVKNWLLSHLYGVVLTITLAATVFNVAAGSNTSHIKRVDMNSGLPVNSQSNVTPAPLPTDSGNEYEEGEITLFMEEYFDAVNLSGGAMTNELKALMLPDSYGLNGHNCIMADRWDASRQDTVGVVAFKASTMSGDSMWRKPTRVYVALEEMGYQPYYAWVYNFMWYDRAMDGGADVKDQYAITTVKIDGKWYVAEAFNIFDKDSYDVLDSEELKDRESVKGYNH